MDSMNIVATPILGAMMGMLVAFPASATEIGVLAWILPVMGAFVGYKRRHSKAFFYFSLFCVTVLSGVVATSMIER